MNSVFGTGSAEVICMDLNRGFFGVDYQLGGGLDAPNWIPCGSMYWFKGASQYKVEARPEINHTLRGA